jgi:CubicO group peptidase (beta-lactamase class C family)
VTFAPPRTDLDALVESLPTELERDRVPGLLLAVVRDGVPAYAGALGVRGVHDPTPATSATLFHLGSCGKAVTGLLAALLAADGVLDLDATVRRYVPELRLPDEVVAARVTTRDLLSHRSGIGRHDLTWIFNPQWSPEDVLRRLEHLSLVGDLRAQWSYSNLGFALAGVVVGRAGGASFDELLSKRVFEPLGMTRTTWSVDVMQADPDHAAPHRVTGGAVVETVYRRLSGVAPAGELVTCADDAVRWLLAQLGVDETLPGSAVSAAQQPAMLLPPGVAPFPELELAAYGLGWISGRYRGERLIWHNGGVDGFCAQALLLPDRRSGVVVSANLHSTNHPFAVALTVADLLLEQPAESSWFDRLRSAEGEAAATAPAPRDPQDLPAAATHPIGEFAGTYRNAGYGDLVVTVDGADLRGRFGDYGVELAHRQRDTWTLSYPPLDVTGSVSFGTSPDGAVEDLVVVFDGDGATVRMTRLEPGGTT